MPVFIARWSVWTWGTIWQVGPPYCLETIPLSRHLCLELSRHSLAGMHLLFLFIKAIAILIIVLLQHYCSLQWYYYPTRTAIAHFVWLLAVLKKPFKNEVCILTCNGFCRHQGNAPRTTSDLHILEAPHSAARDSISPSVQMPWQLPSHP